MRGRPRGAVARGPVPRRGLRGRHGAALSHQAATEHYEVRREPASIIDVVVPRKRIAPGTRFHQAETWTAGRHDVKGIPITTIPRLPVDLTDDHTDDELANVIHEAGVPPPVQRAERRRDAMRRANGRRNLDVLERALALRAARQRRDEEPRGAAASSSRTAGEQESSSRCRTRNSTGFEVDLRLAGARSWSMEVDGDGHARPAARRSADAATAMTRSCNAAGFEAVRRVHRVARLSSGTSVTNMWPGRA